MRDILYILYILYVYGIVFYLFAKFRQIDNKIFADIKHLTSRFIKRELKTVCNVLIGESRMTSYASIRRERRTVR